jgi:hypothetical protein
MININLLKKIIILKNKSIKKLINFKINKNISINIFLIKIYYRKVKKINFDYIYSSLFF